MIEDERLVGAVRDHRVSPTCQKIERITLVIDPRHRLVIDALALEHGRDLIAARSVHEPPAAQIRYACDVRPARHQDDDRRVLEDGCQHDEPATKLPFAKDTGAADTEIGLAAGNLFGDVDSGTALADRDVEPSVAVEPSFKGRVVAGELKLVFPFQLQRNLIERCGRTQCKQDYANDQDFPTSVKLGHGPIVVPGAKPQ